MDTRKSGTNNTLLIILGSTLGLVLILGLWWMTTLNGLNNAQQETERQWSQVENVIDRRNNLTPQLVGAVKGSMKHEDKVFKNIADARKQYSSATDVKGKAKASNELSKQTNILLNAVHENYPKLSSNGQVTNLMTQIEGSENRISVEQKRYNDDVASYNKRVINFPSAIVASASGKHKIEYTKLQTSNKVPDIDLGE